MNTVHGLSICSPFDYTNDYDILKQHLRWVNILVLAISRLLVSGSCDWHDPYDDYDGPVNDFIDEKVWSQHVKNISETVWKAYNAILGRPGLWLESW